MILLPVWRIKIKLGGGLHIRLKSTLQQQWPHLGPPGMWEWQIHPPYLLPHVILWCLWQLDVGNTDSRGLDLWRGRGQAMWTLIGQACLQGFHSFSTLVTQRLAMPVVLILNTCGAQMMTSLQWPYLTPVQRFWNSALSCQLSWSPIPAYTDELLVMTLSDPRTKILKQCFIMPAVLILITCRTQTIELLALTDYTTPIRKI